MVKKTVAIDLQASTKGEESVKSLKSQIKDATNEATILAQKFGQFSPEAAKAAKRVAELKDQMDDFREQVQALHPDKFNRIATVVGGIANGIQAAQGAMALFGAESEDVQKALLKVQGAMAFAQGVEGLIAFKNQFKTLANLLKTQVVGAFTTVAGAARMVGGALGIGLVITAVTTVINNFEKFQEVAKKFVNAIPGLSTVVRGFAAAWTWLKEKVVAATDAMGLTDSKTDAMIEKMQKNIAFLKHAEELAEAQGKDSYEMKRQRIQEEIKMMELQQEEEEKILEKRRELQLLDATKQKEIADKKAADKKAAEDKTREEAEKAAQAQAELLEAEQKMLDDIDGLAKDRRNKELDAYQDFEEKTVEIKTASQIADEAYQKYKEEQQKAHEARLKEIKDKQAEEDKKRADRTKAYEDKLRDMSYNSTVSILGDIADLVGRQTAAGKIAALAEVGISEGRALANALANTQSPKDPTNAITGGLAGIAKFLVIAASITSTAVRARNIIKGGGGSGGVQSVRVAPPNVVPTTTGVLPDRENAGTFAGNGRVYVLEGDITDRQSRVRMLRNTSVV